MLIGIWALRRGRSAGKGYDACSLNAKNGRGFRGWSRMSTVYEDGEDEHHQGDRNPVFVCSTGGGGVREVTGTALGSNKSRSRTL